MLVCAVEKICSAKPLKHMNKCVQNNIITIKISTITVKVAVTVTDL